MRLFYIPFCIVGACTAVLAYQLLGPNGAFFHVEDLRQSLAEQQRQNEQQRLKMKNCVQSSPLWKTAQKRLKSAPGATFI